MKTTSAIVAATMLLGGFASLAPGAVLGQDHYASTTEPAPGRVFRPYGGSGGLHEEFGQLAADHGDIAELVTIGETVNGRQETSGP